MSDLINKNIIGKKIKEALGDRSQRWLAEKAELTEISVCRYVSGERIPNAIAIVKMALALEVSTDYLLGLETNAIPVVHCKNCEHWGTGFAGETEHVKCCKLAIYMVGENGYCVYGERK